MRGGLLAGDWFHERVAPYFEQTAVGDIERVISAHSLAETFRWLSAPEITGAPPLSPQQARE